MNRRLTALLAATFLVLTGLAAPALGAPLPKPKDPAIVPVKSLGGVRLGSSIKAADRKWGRKGECSRRFCTYGGEGERGSAFITKVGDKGVASARIAAGTNRRGKPVYKGPLLRFEAVGKRKRKVGLGSKVGDVKRAFPEAKRTDEGVEIRGSGRAQLSFTSRDGKRVDVIELQSR